jgi:asparagine synthase (glutamine-hydrolysing)
MCGIVGWLLRPGASFDAASLAAASGLIAHRGPDDHGAWADPATGVALAHDRLSIIDLSAAGHQPMVGAGGDVLAYNGELYNYRELRAELEGLGRTFRSRSDTEVVLEALSQWGEAALERFFGMFALAFWSARSRTLLLARDPLGMKPLYLAELPGGAGVAFASEVKAFLALPGFRARMDPRGLRQFLEFGYVYDARATSLAGVTKLPPATSVVLREGRAGEPRRYWEPPRPDRGDRRPRGEREDELFAALDAVVGQHLVADVPVGVLLSGGLDSGIVAALAARRGPLTTVCMGFAESAVDERPFARAVAAHVGSSHHEVLITPGEVTGGLEEVVWYFDDLFADWGTVTTRLLYRRCRDMGIKVVLVGEGSDELFGGYPVFAAAAAMRGPYPVRLFRLYRRYAGRRYGRGFPSYAAAMRRHLWSARGDLFHAVRLFEAGNQLPNNYVMKVDKASMSVGVEARAPFLDRRVAEIACRTPRELLLEGGGTKGLLRTMARRHGLLPEAILARPKFGASIAASWIDESPSFRAYAREAVLGGPWVDELRLRPAMEDYFAGRRSGYRFPRAISIFSNLAWRLLLLTLWSRRYLEVR